MIVYNPRYATSRALAEFGSRPRATPRATTAPPSRPSRPATTSCARRAQPTWCARSTSRSSPSASGRTRKGRAKRTIDRLRLLPLPPKQECLKNPHRLRGMFTPAQSCIIWDFKEVPREVEFFKDGRNDEDVKGEWQYMESRRRFLVWHAGWPDEMFKSANSTYQGFHQFITSAMGNPPARRFLKQGPINFWTVPGQIFGFADAEGGRKWYMRYHIDEKFWEGTKIPCESKTHLESGSWLGAKNEQEPIPEDLRGRCDKCGGMWPMFVGVFAAKHRDLDWCHLADFDSDRVRSYEEPATCRWFGNQLAGRKSAKACGGNRVKVGPRGREPSRIIKCAGDECIYPVLQRPKNQRPDGKSD